MEFRERPVCEFGDSTLSRGVNKPLFGVKISNEEPMTKTRGLSSVTGRWGSQGKEKREGTARKVEKGESVGRTVGKENRSVGRSERRERREGIQRERREGRKKK